MSKKILSKEEQEKEKIKAQKEATLNIQKLLIKRRKEMGVN